MSQVWHLFRCDLRASKSILLAWFGSLAGYSAFAFQDPLMSDWTIHGAILGMLTTLVGVVCAALLVQQDSLIGVQPFWKTRPLSSWELLLSKVLFLLLVFVASHLALCSLILLRFNVALAELPPLLASGSWQWTANMAAGVALATLAAGAAQLVAAWLIVYVATIGAFLAITAAIGGQTITLGGPKFTLSLLALSGVLILLRYGGFSRLKTFPIAVIGWCAFVWLTGSGALNPADEAPAPTEVTSIQRWGSVELEEGVRIEHGDYAAGVYSIATDPEKATIVLRVRQTFRGNSTGAKVELTIVHGPSRNKFIATSGQHGNVGFPEWVGGWPAFQNQKHVLEFEWARQTADIARLGPAALADAELVLTRYEMDRVGLEP